MKNRSGFFAVNAWTTRTSQLACNITTCRNSFHDICWCRVQNQRLGTNLCETAYGSGEATDDRDRQSRSAAVQQRTRKIEDPEAHPRSQGRRPLYCRAGKEHGKRHALANRLLQSQPGRPSRSWTVGASRTGNVAEAVTAYCVLD